jgi:hypothetical protein
MLTCDEFGLEVAGGELLELRMDEGRVASHEGHLLLRREADERDGPGSPLAVKDPA